MRRCKRPVWFKTYHKLQGSQTHVCSNARKKKFKTYHKLQGSQTLCPPELSAKRFKTYHKLQGSQTVVIDELADLMFKTYHKLQGSQTSNLKPQIGHHRTHTTCDSCNLCTLLFYNQTPVAVNNMTPIFYVCQFQLPLLKKYKVYLFILSRLA